MNQASTRFGYREKGENLITVTFARPRPSFGHHSISLVTKNPSVQLPIDQSSIDPLLQQHKPLMVSVQEAVDRIYE